MDYSFNIDDLTLDAFKRLINKKKTILINEKNNNETLSEEDIDIINLYHNIRMVLYIREKKLDFINFKKLSQDEDYKKLKETLFNSLMGKDDLDLCCDIRNCFAHNSFDIEKDNGKLRINLYFDDINSISITAKELNQYVSLLVKHIDKNLIEKNFNIITDKQNKIDMLDRFDAMVVKDLLLKLLNKSDSVTFENGNIKVKNNIMLDLNEGDLPNSILKKDVLYKKVEKDLINFLNKYSQANQKDKENIASDILKLYKFDRNDEKFLRSIINNGKNRIPKRDKNKIKDILVKNNVLKLINDLERDKILSILKIKDRKKSLLFNILSKENKSAIKNFYIDDIKYDQLMSYDIANNMFNNELLLDMGSSYNELIAKVNKNLRLKSNIETKLLSNTGYSIYRFTNEKKLVGQDILDMLLFTFSKCFDKDLVDKTLYNKDLFLQSVLLKNNIKGHKVFDELLTLRNSIIHGDYNINKDGTITVYSYTYDKKNIMQKIKKNIKVLQYNKKPIEEIYKEKHIGRIYNLCTKFPLSSIYTSIYEKEAYQNPEILKELTSKTLSYDELIKLCDILVNIYESNKMLHNNISLNNNYFEKSC